MSDLQIQRPQIAKIMKYGLTYEEATINARQHYGDVDTLAEIIAGMYVTHKGTFELGYPEIANSLGLGEETIIALMTNNAFADTIDAKMSFLMYSPQKRMHTVKKLVNKAMGIGEVSKTIKKISKGEGDGLEFYTEVVEKEVLPNTKDIIAAANYLETKQQRKRLTPRDQQETDIMTPVWEGLSPEDIDRKIRQDEAIDVDFKSVQSQELENEDRQKELQDYTDRREKARQNFMRKKALVGATQTTLPPEAVLRRKTKEGTDEPAKATDFFNVDPFKTTQVAGYDNNGTLEDNEIRVRTPDETPVNYKTKLQKDEEARDRSHVTGSDEEFRTLAKKTAFTSEETKRIIEEKARQRREIRERGKNNADDT